MGAAGVILMSASELVWMAGVEVPLGVGTGLAMVVSSMVLLLEFDPSDISFVSVLLGVVRWVDSCSLDPSACGGSMSMSLSVGESERSEMVASERTKYEREDLSSGLKGVLLDMWLIHLKKV
jgi:hypothetical protein